MKEERGNLHFYCNTHMRTQTHTPKHTYTHIRKHIAVNINTCWKISGLPGQTNDQRVYFLVRNF